jgi:hypothetical protein
VHARFTFQGSGRNPVSDNFIIVLSSGEHYMTAAYCLSRSDHRCSSDKLQTPSPASELLAMLAEFVDTGRVIARTEGFIFFSYMNKLTRPLTSSKPSHYSVDAAFSSRQAHIFLFRTVVTRFASEKRHSSLLTAS